MNSIRGRGQTVIAVSGQAGSGKTTLGRALASALRAPLLDLDTLTNPLLDRIAPGVLDEGGHWINSAHSLAIRAGRYAVLREAAAEVLRTTDDVVIVAPFTAELRGGEDWRELLDAISPAQLQMLHLDGSAQLFERRRRQRGEQRDVHRADVAQNPSVPVISIDASLTTDQQVFRALRSIGIRTALETGHPLFEMEFDAFLFDLDGTLIDSTASVLRSWSRLANEYDAAERVEILIHENHGKPAQHLISQLLAPDEQGEALERIAELEISDAHTVESVPGALELFTSLPDDRRAIVTSGSRLLATARLNAGGFPIPSTFVTADDVSHGKPDPEPFLLAASRLRIDPRRCLAIEDTRAGIEAARAAGCVVLAVEGTSSAQERSGAVLSVDGLDRVTISRSGDRWRLALVEDEPPRI